MDQMHLLPLKRPRRFPQRLHLRPGRIKLDRIEEDGIVTVPDFRRVRQVGIGGRDIIQLEPAIIGNQPSPQRDHRPCASSIADLHLVADGSRRRRTLGHPDQDKPGCRQQEPAR